MAYPIDFYYGQFGGVQNGWGSTNKAVYVDPREFPVLYFDQFTEVLNHSLDLINALYGTEFYYAGTQELDRGQYSDWDFVGITFNPVGNPANFATAAPIADFVNSEWKGGMMEIFPKAFSSHGNIKHNVFKVLNHELGHVLGTSHTNIQPACMVSTGILNELNAAGFMPWDLAVITKFLKGFDRLEVPPARIPVYSSAHITNVGGHGFLYIPLIQFNGFDYTAVLKQIDVDLWQLLYLKKYQNAYMARYEEEFQFLHVASIAPDFSTLVASTCYFNESDTIGSLMLVNEENGKWRQAPQ